MEMEDHNHHNHQYSIDLRQFISGRPTHYPPAIPQPPHPPPADLFSTHRTTNLPPQAHHHYDMMMLMPRGGGGGGGGLHDFHSDSTTTVAAAVCAHPLPPSAAAAAAATTTANSANTTVVAGAGGATLSGLEGEGGGSFGGCDGGTGRWPRQETLTLLEIRSRLDSKFKEANQKGPLWDEVSRILYEEHGYQRSGKKCREKFENLYKYYKKTKEGKAGRQDGKHYRFFRQLEALYGETSNPSSIPDTQFVNNSLRFQTQETTFHSQKLCDSLSLSNNSSEFDTSSSEDNDLSTATLVENDSMMEKRRKRKSWKAKIKEFIDSQMRKLIDRQEAWLEKLTKTLEEKEQERMLREEEWRKQEAARIDREHKFWAKERAWIEARDAALMDALRNLAGKEANNISSSSPAEELLSGEIHTRSENGNEKCETNKESNKKRKETNNNNNNSRNCCYFQSNDHHHHHQSMYNPGGGGGGGYCDEINEHQQQGQETENSNVGNAVSESCFRFLMSDGSENLWENYGLKLSKGSGSS